jgi:hypothetical protein
VKHLPMVCTPMVGMPKSRDFLFALVPGFSERIHPGIF